MFLGCPRARFLVPTMNLCFGFSIMAWLWMGLVRSCSFQKLLCRHAWMFRPVEESGVRRPWGAHPGRHVEESYPFLGKDTAWVTPMGQQHRPGLSWRLRSLKRLPWATSAQASEKHGCAWPRLAEAAPPRARRGSRVRAAETVPLGAREPARGPPLPVMGGRLPGEGADSCKIKYKPVAK